MKIEWACAPGNEGGAYTLSINDKTLRGKVSIHTGTWQSYQTTTLGSIEIGNQAQQTAIVRSEKIPAGKALFNIRRIVLSPIE